MPTTITGSDNIAILDSEININLCTGVFSVSLDGSIWIGAGASNVMGASVKITNPLGVIIKNYPTSGFDIYPPMTSDVDVNVPTQASNYIYGSYIFTVLLTDEDGTTYEVTKSVNICAPDSKNKTRNYGTLSATMDGNCVTGRVTIIADTPPNYKGFTTDSQVNDFVLKYPTVSEVAPEDITVNNFSAQLYEGEYRFEGTICAHYSLGDNVFVYINYRVKRFKTIRCLLDRGCVAARLASLQDLIDSDCTDKEKIATQNTIIQTLLLLQIIDGNTAEGYDPSDFIAKLEDVLGCVCTCNCAEGTPIIPLNPTGDFVIEGCNVSLPVTAGLTTTYTIENYVYITEITANGGAITISAPVLDDCTQTQTITFNIATVYSQIKAQINSSTEYNAWAALINNALSGLDGTCLGLTTDQMNALTFKQKIQAILTGLCVGGSCDAVIAAPTTESSGNDVIVDWQAISGVYEVAVYMDDILQGTVLQPTTIFTIEGASDGDAHTYTIVSKCSNGSTGTILTGSFTYFGCPLIAPPTVTDNNIPDATCPYDLTALVEALPVGIDAEWHNLNNTLASSLVADPTQVTGGSYYVFAKNSDGCYSLGTNVIVVCSAVTACTAPQNLIVEAITGEFRVQFQSAAYPPPLNSYTVKRRLTADPDVSGSYTTLGTPTWNAGDSRWEILDTTGIDNTLYTYRAISNCDSSAPYIDYIFANLTCPTLTLTPDQTTMDYSFTGVGGGVDKYTVSIYDSTGVTLIDTDTHVPAFPTPITGTFIYLTDGTTYKVRVRVWIGTYFHDCAFVASTTIVTDNYTITASYNYNIISVDGTGVPALGATGANGTEVGHHTAMSGDYDVTITGDPVPVTAMYASVNGINVDCVDISAGPDVYVLSITADESDIVLISMVNGTCS